MSWVRPGSSSHPNADRHRHSSGGSSQRPTSSSLPARGQEVSSPSAGSLGARHRRTAARRPLGGANTLGRRADPGDRSDHGIVAALCEPRRCRAARDQRPSRQIICGVVVRARLRSRWAAAGSVVAGELHRSPWNWPPLCRPRRRCAPARVGARASVGEPVLQAGRRQPPESTWMSSYGRYGGASPQPHRGTGACAMTSASGCELLSAIRVPHSR